VDTAALQALLTSGALSPDTYVWKEGMANWLAAKALPEFVNYGKASPPPMPPVPSSSAAPPPSAPASAPVSASDDIDKNRAFAIISYLWILFIVGLIAAPNSKFAKYHANQGLVLFLAELVFGAACIVLMFIPILGHLTIVAGWVAGIVLAVLGIINAASGQCKPLPLIGHFELIK
jgi:uncharacterized membrane protein